MDIRKIVTEIAKDIIEQNKFDFKLQEMGINIPCFNNRTMDAIFTLLGVPECNYDEAEAYMYFHNGQEPKWFFTRDSFIDVLCESENAEEFISEVEKMVNELKEHGITPETCKPQM